MKVLSKILVCGIVAIAGVIGTARPCLALEPVDNWEPWREGTYLQLKTVFKVGPGTSSAVWADIESISPVSDVDYLIIMCGTGVVSGVGISHPPESGDLDIAVYNPNNGAYLGGSTGVDGLEYVALSTFGRQAVAMKVYGFWNSTGIYSVNGYCTP